MPRRNLMSPQEDVIDKYVGLLRQYARNGEAYLGTHPKTMANGQRAKLTHLKTWAYDKLAKGIDSQDNRASIVYTMLRDAELVTEPAPNDNLTQKMVKIFWRPDPVKTALVREGIEEDYLTPEQRQWLEDSKRWVLDHL